MQNSSGSSCPRSRSVKEQLSFITLKAAAFTRKSSVSTSSCLQFVVPDVECRLGPCPSGCSRRLGTAAGAPHRIPHCCTCHKTQPTCLWLITAIAWKRSLIFFYFIHPGSRISDPGHKIENNFELVQKKVWAFWDLEKTYPGSRLPDPEVKKAQDPRSGYAALENWLSKFVSCI